MSSNQKRILVPVDGSKQSLDAVRYVGRIFPSEQSKVVLFHVKSAIPEFLQDMGIQPQYPQSTTIINAWEKAAEESIEESVSIARQILVDKGIPDRAITVEIQPRESGIATDIIAESNQGYDAVVIGRTGLSKFKNTILGTVANKLVEKLTNIPLCLVAGNAATTRILLAIDKSEGSMCAVEYVASMFDKWASKVTLFHAIRGFNIFQLRYEGVVNLNDEQEWMEAYEIQSVFEKAKIHLVKGGFDRKHVTSKVIKDVSSRAGAIVEEAREGWYETIVVGRRGVSKVHDFFMGGVSNKVIQLASDKAVWLVT